MTLAVLLAVIQDARPVAAADQSAANAAIEMRRLVESNHGSVFDIVIAHRFPP